MKKLLILLALATALPVAQTGCSTTPSAQLNAVLTLKVSGETAKAAMDGASSLLKDGTITVAQWQKVADIYRNKFQPAFNLAVIAAQGNYATLSSGDVSAALTEILKLTEAFK